MSRRPLLRLAALLSLLAPLPALAQTVARLPAAHAAGYHWRTLVLRHAVPSDILALMRWNGPAAPATPAPFDLLPLTGSPVLPPPTLPNGVRRIFALQSNNSLLVEATENGFATVAKLVKIFDNSPRQVEFHMALVAVPATRAYLYTPDIPATRLLPLLRAGESRVVPVATETTTEGVTASVSVELPVIAPVSRFRLAQAGSKAEGEGLTARCEFHLTPRINEDGAVTLSLTFATGGSFSPAQASPPRTVRAGEMVVYEVTGAAQPNGERLFLFLSPVIIADPEAAPDGGQPVSGQSVIVTP